MKHKPPAIILLALLLAACGTQEAAVLPLPEGVAVILAEAELSALAIDDGIIWTGGRDGLYRVATESFTAERVEELGKISYVKDIKEVNGDIWVAYEGGVSRKRGTDWLTTAPGTLPDPRANCLLPLPAGGMWVGTWNGAVLLDDNLEAVARLTRSGGELPFENISVMAVAGDGSLLIGSFLAGSDPGGLLFRAPDGETQLLNTAGGMPHDDITDIVAAGDGSSFWVACGLLDRGGAARVASGEGGRWYVAQTLTTDDGLAGAKTRSLFIEEELLWFGSENDGIAVFSKELELLGVLTTEEGLFDNEVKRMARDSDGTLYFAARRGLTRLMPPALAWR
jgi:ligand-binding sensor domain-containing protein